MTAIRRRFELIPRSSLGCRRHRLHYHTGVIEAWRLPISCRIRKGNRFGPVRIVRESDAAEHAGYSVWSDDAWFF